ncbi:MAG: 2-dehydropantoate 2-reductase N-terminal domain-containing protein, partial [Parasphingorhabdus sp.]
MTMATAKIGVIGAGAWGTALAQVLSEGQDELLLWAREPEVIDQINRTHENQSFLPGHRLRNNIHATQDWDGVAACDMLLLVTPAQHLRATLQTLPDSNAALLLCCKGIEAE